METFDPKPALNKYAGMRLGDTPFKDFEQNPLVKKNLREVIVGLHKIEPNLYPMQVGFKKRGQSGIEVSDWWPNVSECIDDISVVRSMWTTDNNHGAQMQFHSGQHVLEGQFPTIGATPQDRKHWGAKPDLAAVVRPFRRTPGTPRGLARC